MLAAAAGVLSQASGLATIDGALMLSGNGPLPLVRGTISFDPVREERRMPTAPLSFIPRGQSRELSFAKGALDIDTSSDGLHRTYTLNVDEEPLTVFIDGEGRLEHVMLDARFRDGAPEYAHVSLDADSIPYHPEALDLLISAKDVNVTLSQDTHTWRASGNVAFAAGRRSERDSPATLRERIEHGLGGALGYAVPTFIRAAGEVRAIAASAPFAPERLRGSAGKLQVALLDASPMPQARERALALAGDRDGLVFDEREVYWLPSGGVLGSALDMTVLARTLGSMTIRTKGTIEQIAAKHFP